MCPEGSAALRCPVVGMIHLFILALLVGVKWYLVLVIGIFLVIHDAEHVFMCSLTISASSFVTLLFMSLLLRYGSSICILDVTPMSNTRIEDTLVA